MYTNRVLGTAKCVLFIEVSSFQDVLNKGLHCIHVYTRLRTNPVACVLYELVVVLSKIHT